METLIAKRDGAAYGKETGRSYLFSEGDILHVEEGDLDHYGAADLVPVDEEDEDTDEEEEPETTEEDGGYQTRPLTPSDTSLGPFQRGEHQGGGYYEVLDADGNPVEDEDGEPLDAGQGREKADAQLEALNDSLS